EAMHLGLAGIVGVLGGLVNLVFFYGIEYVKLFFLRRPGDPVEVAEMMPMWQCVLIPVLGGLAAGLVLHWGLRLVGPQGSTNMLEVVVAGDGKLPFRSNLVKAASSLVSIGTGASIGREGGVTQLTATLASKLGQLAKWPPYRLRLLVGCGAASGIAAAYNAPIAGAVFAALIVLGNFSMNLFAPLVFASVIASMVSRSFFGIRPWYVVPPFEFSSVLQLPWFLLLGLICGVLGAIFLKMLRRSEERFAQLPWPIYVKLALSGLIVGLIAIEFPGVWGNGYAVTNRILHDQYDRLAQPWLYEYLPMPDAVLVFLAALFLGKLLATVATVGSGAVGGVFTPTLFLGASLGALYGTVLHRFHGALELPTSTFALVGMGSVLAATTRSPLLAMIMVFEISLDYSLMPPLMLGCVVSILIAGRLHPESIYTETLRLRGLELGRETAQPGAAAEQRVGDLMHAPVPPMRENTPLKEIAERFLTSPNNFLPVVDAQSRLIGVVALQDLKEYLGAGDELRAVIAYDVMRPPPQCVTPSQRLLEVLPVVLESELRNVPVVSSFKENRLVGSLERGEVLAILSEAIAVKSNPTG
ncbi:MAG TPA: ClcB-like voltage-gated chloride channel protein, partial [Verrucomicrobiae bacterium]|nr:ClcB-like voltage-gated chloride channel protein [Verrucomicrobiae bacterium]